MFKKILIANRGEIAVRIIRACNELDIQSVAVYSEADRTALHVRMADEAYFIGPAPSVESYLVIDKILDVARQAKVDAIHPGYGFLAENSQFAQRVAESNFCFIGPRAHTIALLGDKLAARQCMTDAGIPIVPGYKGKIENVTKALSIAENIGYPVLIKAAAGGGGKGMRIVRDRNEMKKSLEMAQSEAKSAFGDNRVYIEKYLENPHHIEIQILADTHGNIIHLGERECSIQRRHQKVIEESPSPVVDHELRKKMGQIAVKAGKAAGYVNAGTVEFLVDQAGNFYFLEVNTRIQVEHPVTEMVTGIDLVKEQVKIAAGEPLPMKQKDVKWTGSAIECRIYAEDPDNNFFPSTGVITKYIEPQGPGIRVDSGFRLHDEFSLYYDPIISKLITWGNNRKEAIQRMKRALKEYEISGIHTIIPLHNIIMNHPKFIAGDISTHFIQEEILNRTEKEDSELLKVLAMTSSLLEHNRKIHTDSNYNNTRNFQPSKMWKYCGRKKLISQ